ncbi:MAG TPA: endonuclease domain-containing protein [Rhodanobacteraceae bacterium]
MVVDRSLLKVRARELRARATPAENVLWRHLRLRQLSGLRFLRQYVIADYILDFYAPAVRLAIELDGGQHYAAMGHAHDTVRTARLARHGVTVLRYSNLDVARRMDDVLADVQRAAEERLGTHPPDAARRPPSSGRG